MRTLAVGAPPDLLNTVGQNWGLAGFSGVGLQASGFAPFREMLRASMRYAGAIRLDHVLGLKRLYFIPAGLPPDQGAYVRMPFESCWRSPPRRARRTAASWWARISAPFRRDFASRSRSSACGPTR